MLLDENEIKKEISELLGILQPEAMSKVVSHLVSISQKVEDLSKSRNEWKKKFEDLKMEKEFLKETAK